MMRAEFEIALEGAREMALAGEIRAVADPDGQRLRADLAAEMDAFEIVLDGLQADGLIRMAERPELVGKLLAGRILEGVGVHRVEAKAQRFRLLLQLGGVGDPVPGDMQGDARRSAGQAVDDGAVVQLVEDVARLALAREAGEARAAGADAPGGDGDGERGGARFDHGNIGAAAGQSLA